MTQEALVEPTAVRRMRVQDDVPRGTLGFPHLGRSCGQGWCHSWRQGWSLSRCRWNGTVVQVEDTNGPKGGAVARIIVKDLSHRALGGVQRFVVTDVELGTRDMTWEYHYATVAQAKVLLVAGRSTVS